MSKIALFILYNHRYDKNISRIEELYKEKFTFIYHIVPFYDGNKKNVLPVYESSYQFQSYIAQAYQQLQKTNEYTHYFIVADDMILNPAITEKNLFDFTGIDEKSCFITDFRDLKHNINVPLFCSINKKGAEVKTILPKYGEAIEKIRLKGLFTMPYTYVFLIKYIFYWLFRFRIKKVLMGLYYLFIGHKRKSLYPIIWGYSDILIVTESAMQKFCTYCGCFAACNIFVEQALPTALILSAEKIVLKDQIKKDVISQLSVKERAKLEQKYNFNLADLIRDFPSNTFFIHPIKLSQWK